MYDYQVNINNYSEHSHLLIFFIFIFYTFMFYFYIILDFYFSDFINIQFDLKILFYVYIMNDYEIVIFYLKTLILDYVIKIHPFQFQVHIYYIIYVNFFNFLYRYICKTVYYFYIIVVDQNDTYFVYSEIINMVVSVTNFPTK